MNEVKVDLDVFCLCMEHGVVLQNKVGSEKRSPSNADK
jgi:hypothetical protein